MKSKKIKKILSLCLITSLLIGMIPVTVKADQISETPVNENVIIEPENNVFIQKDGENIETVSMFVDEKIELEVFTTINEEEKQYRWEILIDVEESLWVPFYEMNENKIEISYGMLSNFLDENNLIQLRASVISGEDEYVSDRILIEVVDKDVETKDESVSVYDLKKVKEIEDNMVTITINYMKNTGENVCDPYVATIYKGMHFATTVLSPVITGYEPKLNESDTELAKEYTFNFDSVNDDIVVNIYYFPVEVRYEVRYYLQNIYDDDYVMFGSPIVAYGKVGTEPDESLIGAKFDGFVQVNYQPDLIASDGNTVFQCFYDREYYLVDLDLDGGHGVDSVYAKYGTVFVVNEPEKAGYIFDGWDVDNDGYADEIDSSVPAKNITYKALWKTTNTTYTIAYWLNDDSGNSFIGSRIVHDESSSIVSGQDDLGISDVCGVEEHTHNILLGCYNCDDENHSHDKSCLVCDKEEHTHGENGKRCEIDVSKFEYVPELTDKNIIVNGDGSTVVNVYYKYKEYTLKFYYAKEENGAYYVCGNSTLFANGNTIVDQFSNTYGQWGRVKSLPTMSSTNDIDVSIYETGYDVYTIGGTEGKYYYIKFTESYNADISKKWPVGIFDRIQTYTTFDYGDYAYFSAWNVDSNSWYDNNFGNKTLKGNYQRLDYQMLIDNNFDERTINFLAFWENGKTGLDWNKPHKWTYNVYIPILSGDTEYVKEYQGVKYDLYGTYIVYDNNTSSSGSQYCEQTPTALEGFKISKYDAYKLGTYDTTYGLENHQIDFYYTRNNDYKLKFYNYGKLENDKTQENMEFGASLKQYYYEPEYPESLEENAYEFEGWYTTAGHYEGTKVDFDELTMPASNLALYANWVPVVHTVTFYNTYQDMINENEPLDAVNVSHGSVVQSNDVPDVYNQGYIAGEWFYIKNGEKVAYRPISIAVKNDLKVYRDWSSNVVVEYIVYYYKLGTTESVADPTTGWMFDGSTKTFDAKGGGELAELYDAYNDGWYPTLSSTSIVADKNVDNVVIFYYDYQNPNPYTVRYVDSSTGKEIANAKVVSDNFKSVVTEVYRVIEGYIPDAYYKQLVLSLNKDNDPNENVITFYYSKSENNAYYAVEYYFMNTDGNTYRLNAKIQSPIAVGTAASIPEVSTDGYTLKKCTFKGGNDTDFVDIPNSDMNNIIVNEDGALIRIYYERAKTSYSVHYYVAGTKDSLKPDKYVDDIYFGTVITEDAGEDVEGYTLVSDREQTKELVLDSDYNIFSFYYEETLKTARYKAVCIDDRMSDANFGSVSKTMDVKKWSKDYESVTIYEKDRFYFDGWYRDEEFADLITREKTITPTDNTDITYYALFRPYYTNLTIEKNIDGQVNNSQTYVFNIIGMENNNDHINIEATIHGAGSVEICHLPLGEYKVIERTDWSWKYNSEEDVKTIELELDENENIVDFTNSLGNSAWLSCDDYKVDIAK